jgi:hypothetical protein
MVRHCDVCSAEYVAKRRSSRFCSDRCRKRANRGVLTGHAKVLELQMEPSPLVAAVEAELRDAGRLGSSVGQQALHLAIRMTTSAFDTGSSVAALNKELTVTMQRALKDVIIGVGPLDELRVRRARKLTGK